MSIESTVQRAIFIYRSWLWATKSKKHTQSLHGKKVSTAHKKKERRSCVVVVTVICKYRTETFVNMKLFDKERVFGYRC